METTQKENQEIDQETYKINKKTIFLMFILAISSLLAGFVLNFSLEEKVLTSLSDLLRKNRSCPIYYKSANLSYFLPKITMDNIEVSPRCIRAREGLVIEKAKLSLGLPSFSPVGLTLSSEISKVGGFDTNLNIKSIHNFSSQYLKIEDSKISLSSFEQLMGKFKVEGDMNVNALLNTDLKNIKGLDLYLLSKNFTIPSQVIQNFELPTLQINNISLKAHSDSGDEVEIQELIVGDQNSAIRAKATGTISLNKRNIALSKIDIEAQVKFTAEFIEQFAILNLLLGSAKPDEQGFYHMRVDGLLSRPNAPKMINR